jgi:anti-anti-sigma regulatory factor
VVIGRALGTVVVTVHGTLDGHAAQALEALLRDLIDNQGNRSVAIDLRAASGAHPAVVDVLAAVTSSARRRGSSLWLHEPPQELYACMGASAITALDIRPTRPPTASSTLSPRMAHATVKAPPGTPIPPELRPVERRILRLTDAGLDDADIARRFGHSPDWVRRVRSLAAVPRRIPPEARDAKLRPLERRHLRWRGLGLSHESLASKFGRSAGFLARVEQLPHYKLGQEPVVSHAR